MPHADVPSHMRVTLRAGPDNGIYQCPYLIVCRTDDLTFSLIHGLKNVFTHSRMYTRFPGSLRAINLIAFEARATLALINDGITAEKFALFPTAVLSLRNVLSYAVFVKYFFICSASEFF